MERLAKIEKSVDFWFLILTSVLFFLLRLPSLFEPYWYGDEGIYQAIGIAIRNGQILYESIWDNKPPFLYILYAIFNSDQFTIRLLSLLCGIASVVIFYFLAKNLFFSLTHIKKQVQYTSVFITTLLFSFLFATPIYEGNIANAENFVVPLALLAGLRIYTFSEKKYQVKTKQSIFTHSLFWTGILLGIAFLFKIVAVFDTIAFGLFLFFISYPSTKQFFSEKKLQKHVLLTNGVLFLGFSLPIILTSIYFVLAGAFLPFIQGSFLQNVDYVGYRNDFFIPQGFLLLKSILLTLAVGFLFLKRTAFPKPILFILLWVMFSLFNTYFSQRPYGHYVLVLIASFSLLTGLIILNTKYRRFAFLITIVIVFLIYNTFSYSKKTIAYYHNFLEFLQGAKSLTAYQSFFDRNTPTDYAVAQFINRNTTKSDNIYVWGNNAQLYKLTNKVPPSKYTVSYHIRRDKKTVTAVQQSITKANPKFIVIMQNVNDYPFSLQNYTLRFQTGKAAIYERIL